MLTTDLALFETYPDTVGTKRYFIYEIKTDEVTELTKAEYQAYRQEGTWTNLVTNEAQIKYMIDMCKTVESKRIQVKEITNETDN